MIKNHQHHNLSPLTKQQEAKYFVLSDLGHKLSYQRFLSPEVPGVPSLQADLGDPEKENQTSQNMLITPTTGTRRQEKEAPGILCKLKYHLYPRLSQHFPSKNLL